MSNGVRENPNTGHLSPCLTKTSSVIKAVEIGKPRKTTKKYIPPPVIEKDEQVECNRRLIEEVATEMSLTKGMVENIIQYHAQYTHRVIKSGTLEGVFFPYLGKIQPKLKLQQYKNFFHALVPQMRKMLKERGLEAVKVLYDENDDK